MCVYICTLHIYTMICRSIIYIYIYIVYLLQHPSYKDNPVANHLDPVGQGLADSNPSQTDRSVRKHRILLTRHLGVTWNIQEFPIWHEHPARQLAPIINYSDWRFKMPMTGLRIFLWCLFFCHLSLGEDLMQIQIEAFPKYLDGKT